MKRDKVLCITIYIFGCSKRTFKNCRLFEQKDILWELQKKELESCNFLCNEKQSFTTTQSEKNYHNCFNNAASNNYLVDVITLDSSLLCFRPSNKKPQQNQKKKASSPTPHKANNANNNTSAVSSSTMLLNHQRIALNLTKDDDENHIHSCSHNSTTPTLIKSVLRPTQPGKQKCAVAIRKIPTPITSLSNGINEYRTLIEMETQVPYKIEKVLEIVVDYERMLSAYNANYHLQNQQKNIQQQQQVNKGNLQAFEFEINLSQQFLSASSLKTQGNKSKVDVINPNFNPKLEFLTNLKTHCNMPCVLGLEVFEIESNISRFRLQNFNNNEKTLQHKPQQHQNQQYEHLQRNSHQHHRYQISKSSPLKLSQQQQKQGSGLMSKSKLIQIQPETQQVRSTSRPIAMALRIQIDSFMLRKHFEIQQQRYHRMFISTESASESMTNPYQCQGYIGLEYEGKFQYYILRVKYNNDQNIINNFKMMTINNH